MPITQDSEEHYEIKPLFDIDLEYRGTNKPFIRRDTIHPNNFGLMNKIFILKVTFCISTRLIRGLSDFHPLYISIRIPRYFYPTKVDKIFMRYNIIYSCANMHYRMYLI